MPERAKREAAWTRVAFGDVVRQVKDRVDPEQSGLERYVAGEHMDTDDLRLRRWGEVGDGYLGPAFHMRFKPGHVLYGSRRTYLRKVAVADFEGITANTTYVLESIDPHVLLPELLPFIMQTEVFNQHSVRESKGSVNPYVNFSDLAWYEFALPPLEEQRRMVTLLQATCRHRSALESLVASALTGYGSAIESLVARALSESRVMVHTEGELNAETYPLGEAALITDCKHRTPRLVDRGIPMVAPGDIRWGPLELLGCKQIPEEEFPEFMDHVKLRPGDLVLSRNQSFGIASYVGSDTRFALGQDTVAVQPRLCSSAYLYVALRSAYVQRQIRRFSAGSTFGRINLGDIRQLKIPKASQLIQQRAGDLFAVMERRIAQLGLRVGESRRLSADLVNQAMTRGRSV